MQHVFAPLFEWAYGIWPSYGPAVVLASLVISAFHVPFAILEARRQRRVLAQATREVRGDPVLRDFRYAELLGGRNLVLFLARRAFLLGSAVLVLVTVMDWEQRRGEMSFAGIDLRRSVFTVAMSSHGADWPVVIHSVIPAVFVLVYAMAGTKRVAGSRTMLLVGAALIALLVPGAVVLYLLTVLLVNAGVVRLMARAAVFARSNLMARAATVAGLEQVHADSNGRVRAPRWADYQLPADLLQDGSRLFWGGWLGCFLAVVATVAAELYVLAAIPNDPQDLLRAFDTAPVLVCSLVGTVGWYVFARGGNVRWLAYFLAVVATVVAELNVLTPLLGDSWDLSAHVLAGSLVATAGMYVYARGEHSRWMGETMLSRIRTYRHEHGFRERVESLPALNRSLPRQVRGTGIGLMALGGLGACGVGCVGIMLGLRYTRELVVGEGASLSVSVVPLVVGIMLMTAGNVLLRVGGRHVQRTISSPKDLVAGSYALYLRTFEEDSKLARLLRVSRPSTLIRGYFTAGDPQEVQLCDALSWAGLPVSVGQPGERVPHAGVPRMYLPLHGWQEPVREMMRGASLVALVLGHGAGTLWELGEAMRILPPQRLVLLVTMPRDEYDQCRKVAKAELREQAKRMQRETGTRWKPPKLPDYVEGPVGASRIRGLIYFTSAWEAVFTPLERPPLLENPLMGALDRSMWPVAVQLTDYELQTGKRHG